MISLLFVNISYAGLQNIFGLDNFSEIYATKHILESNHLVPSKNTSTTVYPYPAIHIIGASLVNIINKDLSLIARYSGVVFGFFSLLFFNLILRGEMGKKPTLMGSLAFIYSYYIICHFGFGRFPFSIIYFFMLIFILIKFSCKSKYLILLMSICGIPLVISHPLTRITIVIFIFSYIVSKKINIFTNTLFENISKKDTYPHNSLVTIIIIILIYIFLHIAFLSGKTSNFLFILRNHLFLESKKSGYTPGVGLGVNIRKKFFNYGQIGIFFIFQYVLLIKRKKINKNIYFVFILFYLALLPMNFIIYKFDVVNIWRFTIFFWPSVLLPFVYIYDRTDYKKLFSIIILLFIIINLAGINTYQYDKKIEQEVTDETYSRKLTQQEYISVRTFNISGKIVGNHYISVALQSHTGNTVYEDPIFYFNDYNNNTRYDWFIFDDRDKKFLFLRGKLYNKKEVSNQTYNQYQSCNRLVKTYDNGQIEFYKIEG